MLKNTIVVVTLLVISGCAEMAVNLASQAVIEKIIKEDDGKTINTRTNNQSI